MSQNLPIIPALLHAAILGLLSAAVPLKATSTSVTIALLSNDGSTKIVVDPSPREVSNARALHVLAFTSQDDLLLAESEGAFSLAEWDEVVATARDACCQRHNAGLDTIMGKTQSTDMRHFIRSAMEAKVASDFQWK